MRKEFKQELYRQIACYQKRAVIEIARGVFAAIRAQLLKGNAVEVDGVGMFYPKFCGARRAANIATKAPMMIPSGRRIFFRCAPRFRALLNEGLKDE